MHWNRRWVLATAVVVCAMAGCTPDDSEGLTLENCTNGIDDDGNGATDCADTRCTLDAACLARATCGNSLREGLEFCDGADLGGASCETQGFLTGAGTLGCRADCAGFDTSACIRADLCGNGTREGGEQCDDADLGDATCLSRGFASGTIACDSLCQLDESGCSGVNPCGNGTVDGGEACDGDNLDGETCASLGFRGDGLACTATCDAFDTSACEIELCGNGRIDLGELCDDAALPDGRSCSTEGFASGTLACNETCDGLLTADCSLCGNNVIDAGETCDGTALGGRTCPLEGFFAGELACNTTCDGYDTSSCSDCGNGDIDAGEVCDGDNLGTPAETCFTRGYQQGDVACAPDCRSFDTNACTGFASCGNGTLDGLTTATGTGSDVRIFQEFCEPGVAFGVDPFVLVLNELTTGCNDYVPNNNPITCNTDCTIDISACGAPADFCLTVGWYNDGICDPCEQIAGTVDPDCQHEISEPTSCGDGVADGDVDGRARDLNPGPGMFFVDYPDSPFDPCDGDDLRDQTCETLGFKSGTLSCRDDCNFNTSACVPFVYNCGDGVVEGREVCEPSQTCSEYDSRFTGGTFNCVNGCFTADTSGCTE